MQKIITTVGNVVSGSARSKETLEWLSNDIFGKVVQVKKGVTIDRDKTSINLNENMDSLVPASKISDMATGWICGQTARDFVKTKTGVGGSMNIQESEEFKTTKFFCKTDFDMGEIKKEEAAYVPLPRFYTFKSREERERILYKNFVQVGQDVKEMIKDVLNKRGCEMKHVRMFVIILLVSAVATVYGKERHGTETGTAQLSIYKLPPLERAIRCTKYYEGWHGEKKHWPYVGWGHKVLPGESFTNDITKAQGDSILRADMMKLCRLFSRFGRDSTLLSCLAYRVGPYRLLGSKDFPKSKLIQKLEAGNRDIYKEYISFRCYKGKVVPSIERRRKVEYLLLFEE